MKKSIIVLAISLLTSALHSANIFMAGDSTCANYPEKSAPQTGWGQMLQQFCKENCKVYNFAKPGASSRSFIEKKLWDNLIAKVQKGDFVIVQFGHNDSKKNHNRFAAPGAAYDANLKKFSKNDSDYISQIKKRINNTLRYSIDARKHNYFAYVK